MFINQLKKLALLGFSLIVAGVFIAGCGQDTTSNHNEKLIVGMNPTYEPFEFQGKTSDIEGFDVDLMKEIGKKLNKPVEFKSIPFDALIPALAKKDINIVATGMSITKARKEKVDFTMPYFRSSMAIVTKDPSLTSPDSLKGKTIAVQMGTTPADAAHKIDGAIVKEFDHASSSLLELKNGNAQAVLVDMAVARNFMKEHPEDGIYITDYPNTQSYMGMAVNKDNKELLDQVNKALEEMKADGTLEALYQKWFNMSVPSDLPIEYEGK